MVLDVALISRRNSKRTRMKHFFLFCVFPALAVAENMDLTEQLGKTVLYGDIALSPDGQDVAWVQSTVAAPLKQTYVRPLAGNSTAMKIDIGNGNERADAEPAWSPDSKRLAILSTAGEKNEQRQLWIVNADGSGAKKVTNLAGYTARPRWSRDGKQIAVLYIEGAGGGGPLMAHPPSTGIIDKAIHNQRIAVLDVATGEVRQVSPPDLHIYDFDWSPDNKTFAVTAAPGPGDNNWWIAQIYKIDIASGKATSIYKPLLQVAVPRWSPDGKQVGFIEGIMSDEGFHGGDLLTISANGGPATNRTPGRKTSVSSFFWLSPDQIRFTEYVGGGSAISEISLSEKSARTILKVPEGIHAFGNFPNFALSQNGQFAAAVRGDYNTPPEVWAGPTGNWQQLTKNNSALPMTWGKAESIEWTNDGFNIQGWLVPPAKIETGKKYPMVVLIHGGPSGVTTSEWPAGAGMARAIIAGLSSRGYFVLLPNPRGSRRRDQKISDRPKPPGRDRLELWRIHDDVDCHPNGSIQSGRRRRGDLQLAELLRPKFHRPMDDSVLRRIRLRRSGCLRQKFADQVHQEC